MAEMTLKQAWECGNNSLKTAGVEEATLDSWYLLEWATGVSKARYFMDPSRSLSDEESQKYLDGIARRGQRIPLQHITGEQEFMGLKFLVNEHVLVPRQDTEILVEEGLKRIRPNMRVLDMCTGSGCIIISLEQLSQKDFSGYNCKFVGADISLDALSKAGENVKLHNANVELKSTDLFENIEGEFDIIISNPPYIRTSVIEGLEEEVKCHDPFIALDGKEDGLYFYRRIVDEGRDYLKSGGWLLFEIGHDQREDVMSLMKEAGYDEISAKKDLAGLDRVVMARYNKG
jgi:release factor glutamine methyltransferase